MYIAPLSISSDEVLYFDYFRIACTEEFSGFFNGQLWKNLILQASYAEPFMLNAVLAIGALRLSQLGHCSRSDMLQYSIKRSNMASEALSKVIAEMSRNNTVDWKTVLLGSIVLLAVEVLHGNEAGALLHFRGASSILKGLANEGASLSSTIVPSSSKQSLISYATTGEFDEVITAFTRLSIEQYPFVGLRSGDSHNIPTLPPRFQTLSEARNTFNSIVSSMYAFIRQYGHQSYKTLPWHPLPMMVSLRLENLQRCLQDWNQKLNLFLSMRRTRKAEDERGANVLLVHYLVAWVKVSTICFADMLVCDGYLPEFKQIVALSERIVNTYNQSLARVVGPCYTLDIAMAQPLYFVAQYCRCGIVRRHAIQVLRTVGTDGIYTGRTVASIADWIVRTEEGGMRNSIVSEEMRLRNVTFDIQQDGRTATVFAERQNMNGDWVDIHNELVLN